jgi:hypothetical protein
MNTNDAVGTRLGQIMDESIRLARAAWKAALLYVVVLSGIGIVIDQMAESAGANFVFSIMSIALGYVLTVQLLRDGGLVSGNLPTGFGSYFGLSILSGLGIVLGMLVLVIPGLVLLVRWVPAYGYVMGEGDGITDGMGKAWRESAPHFWPIALALLVPVSINAAALAAYLFAGDEQGMVSLPLSALINIAISVVGVAITAIGMAAYSLLRDRSAQIAEIFE